MRYIVKANTGQSLWPVTELETSPQVEAYLNSQSAFRLTVQSGQSGMYALDPLSITLANLIDAQLTGQYPGTPEVHEAALRAVLGLVRLAAVHTGAAIMIESSMVLPPES